MRGRAFVTGGSGFVGGAVVRHLVMAGREVVAVARSDRAAATVQRAGARAARGNVLDPTSLRDAMAGVEVVFHAAGIVAPCARDPSEMLRTNVIGTSNVVEVAAAAGVRRLVHTSSTAAIGEAPGTVGDERTPHRGWFASEYERSKFESEVLAFARGRQLGLEVVCVNPSSVQGPGRTEGTARLLLGAARGRVRVVVRTAFSLVDVDDCAAGHLLAAEEGESGRRYVLSGATLTAEEALGIVQEVIGRRRRVVVLPPEPVLAASSLMSALARLGRRDPPVCRAAALALVHGRRFDGSLATRELGLSYRPVAETIGRTIEWFRNTGRLGDRRAGGAQG
jgi:dihydroflavonol-4-reductase